MMSRELLSWERLSLSRFLDICSECTCLISGVVCTGRKKGCLFLPPHCLCVDINVASAVRRAVRSLRGDSAVTPRLTSSSLLLLQTLSRWAETVASLSTFCHCSRQGSQFEDDFLIPAGRLCECRKQQDSQIRFQEVLFVIYIVNWSVCKVLSHTIMSPLSYYVSSGWTFPFWKDLERVSLK